jgi:U2-associated protein SR140
MYQVPGAERSRSRSPSRSPDRRRYSRSRSRDRYHSRSRSRERPYHSRRPQSRSRSRSRSRSPRRRRRSRSPYSRRSANVDPDAESFIRTVASKVREQGHQFEDVLRERENGKPKFAFLWDERVNFCFVDIVTGTSNVVSLSLCSIQNIDSIAHY